MTKLINNPEELEKEARLNKEWRDESIKFEMGSETLPLKKCYERAIEQSKEIYNKNRKIALECIPDGKYILYVNETQKGILGHLDIPYIDKDRLEKMYLEETGSAHIDHPKFQERNMRYCLGTEENEDKVRVWNAFHENAPALSSDCIGVIFSGSEADIKDEVHEDRIEMTKKVQHFARIVKESGLPMLGVCFGGQMLSHEEGADIDFVRDNTGNKITISGINIIIKTKAGLDSSLTEALPKEIYVAENHKQEIIPNEKGEVLMQNNSGRVEMIFYKDTKTICIQFHPEVGFTRLDIADNILKSERKYEIWKNNPLLIREVLFPIFLRECTRKV